MDSDEPTSAHNVPLPENVELLTSGELLGLLKEHCNQLQSYVTKFHPQDELKQEVEQLRSRLQLFEQRFQGLQGERAMTQKRLEECRILEAQYVKKWQDLRQRVMDKYSDDSLKKGLESQIHHWDDLSSQLEMKVKHSDNLDDLLKEYMQARVEYHTRREKLATWNQQGKLRI
ncbi:SRN2 (YLR119W) [Zygosaccharomyces parabailii]|nr:SRN2 (YLR119W) [Zygosaccharomyces parabailii]CDH10677.1 related to Protein SRN2 [Zygosaccharomyces bailii ISA1307]